MMHLRESEFIDFADGRLPPSRATHLETCAACRREAEELRDVLRAASDVDMPEPSPLFWDHFSARVSDVVSGEAPGAGESWAAGAAGLLMPIAVVAALVIAVVSATLLPRFARTSSTDGTLASSHTPDGSVAPAGGRSGVERDATVREAPVEAQDAEVWAVLTSAASDMGLEEAHAAGMRAHPAAIDHAVQRLNQAELTELGRLLRTEMKRSSD
jgi:hypothetical protein